jgi:hypothetical protein
MLVNGTWTANDYDPALIPLYLSIKPCVVKNSAGAPSVYAYLNPNDRTKDVAGSAIAQDGTDGQFMTEIPAFHWRYTIIGDVTEILVSHEEFPGSTLHWAFQQGSTTRTHRYIGQFPLVWSDDGTLKDGDGTTQVNTTDDALYSVPGFTPKTYLNMADIRSCAANAGACFHQMDWPLQEAFQTLWYVWFKSLDSQTDLPGWTGASSWDYSLLRVNGRVANWPAQSLLATDDPALDEDLKGVTGGWNGVADLPIQNSFLGVQDFFGAEWEWRDGILVNFIDTGGTAAPERADVYRTDDPSEFADVVTNYDLEQAGTMPVANGYIKTWIPGTMIPEVVGGASDTFLCDYYSTSTTAGVRGVRVGGSATRGVIAGVACLYAFLTPAFRDSGLGGRLAA